jgi:hypothetical protein
MLFKLNRNSNADMRRVQLVSRSMQQASARRKQSARTRASPATRGHCQKEIYNRGARCQKYRCRHIDDRPATLSLDPEGYANLVRKIFQ